jgi:hypothetical protein
MVMCAADSGTPGFATETNTANAQHPSGIFDFTNHCGGQGGDPPGDSAFLRIAEHEASGNAGSGAYGRFVFATPPYIHFRAAGGYTRQPNAFNDGWRSRFWALDFAGAGHTLVNQGAGLSSAGTDRPSSNTFGPHLWPFTDFLDFHHFYFELVCVRAAGCDRANFNATDVNGFVLILSDDENPDLHFSNGSAPLMQGSWVRGPQSMSWYVHDNGSGVRGESISLDATRRYYVDHQALGHCNATFSLVNGEFARVYQPCGAGPYEHSWTLETSDLPDGAHALQLCAQDYGQYRGLNGTVGATCDSRTIHTDNTPPGAPVGLEVTSANPNRYRPDIGARWQLPPDAGSPIAALHYNVVDSDGEVLVPAHTVAATDPNAIDAIQAPEVRGDYRLRVWLEDSVGLTGPAATVAIPRDTTPPAAPQDLALAAPETPRSVQGFDLRWRNVADPGSPIDAAHYEVLDGAGQVVVSTQTARGEGIAAIADLEAPRQSGPYALRLWLEDEEGNVGAPVTAPLSYRCVRSEVGGASELSAGLGANGAAEVVLHQGDGSTLSGHLSGPGGGVAGAAICVFARVITESDADFLGVAISGPGGEYRFSIPPGASRELSARYRSQHRELNATALAQTIVHPTFEVTKKVVYNKHYAKFTGSLPGPANNEVVVVAQVKRGEGWLAYHRYRTRNNGEVTLVYRLTRTFEPTRYKMRLQVRSQSGYPYLQGNSDELTLVVRPKHQRR